jgi:hypothetical protein
MKTDLISPKMHALNDYVLSAVLLSVPPAIGLDQQALLMYRGAGLNLLGYNTFSDHSLAVKRMIPLKEHHKMDMANLVGLTLGVFSKPIRQNKKALLFHLGILTLTALNVVLTDWSSRSFAD